MNTRKYFLVLLTLTYAFVMHAQTKVVSGVVIDEELGEPVIGAAVVVKGSTTIGTVTDIDGRFTLTNIPKEAKILLISYLGMSTQELAIAPNVKVILKSDTQLLDEVVITGMQQMDKRLFTGASDKLTADDVKLDGIPDVSRALEGRSAGVSVQNVSGTFGTAPRIRVRGATSIYGNSKPLWVVDGVIVEDVVEISADDLSSGDANTLISSAISGLNADDIESFQVLKDGSATSIYGARAMAGVIVITTKKGKEGSSSISYTGEYTTRFVPSYRNFNIMNSQEQMGFYKELREKGWLNFSDSFRAANSGVYGKMFHLMNTYDPETKQHLLANTKESEYDYLRQAEYRNTDWFDLLFSNALMRNHSLSLSTGTKKSTTYFSLSLMNDPGWMKKSNVKRYTANVKTSYNINDKLTLLLASNGSYRNQMAPGTVSQRVSAGSAEVSRKFDINPYSYALNTSRALDPDEYYQRNYAPFNIFNELEKNNITLNVTDIRFQGELKWKPIRGMEASFLSAVKYNTSTQEHRIYEGSNNAMAYRAMGDATIRSANTNLYKDPEILNGLPEVILPQGGFYKTSKHSMFSYDMRATLSYNTALQDTHILNFFGGAELNSQERSNNAFDGWGMQYEKGEKAFFDYRAFKQMREKNQNYYWLTNTRKRNLAFFSMATYSYQGKYTLTGTARYEGTNRLGKSRNARWLPTWNIAGAWNMHEESFFEALKPNLSHFTLKGSYSLTADAGPASNSQILIYDYSPWRPFAQLGESGLKISSLENEELTYEKKHELNIGLDCGFLNNRISLTADWYTRNNFDLMGIMYTQGAGGSGSRFANVASMKSHGVEFSVSTKNFVTQKFRWTSDLVFGYNQNEITSLISSPMIFTLVHGSGRRVGYPVGAIFSVPSQGLDSDGLPQFYFDTDIDQKNYRGLILQRSGEEKVRFLKYEGSKDPTFTGSFGNVFSYKNFKLNVFVTFSGGNVIRLDPVFKGRYSDLDATPRDFKNRWALSGDENFTGIPVIADKTQNRNVGALGLAYNTYNYSTDRIADGGFVRMKEISLSYDVPKSILKDRLLNSMSIKLQGTNLFLIYADKKLNGQDPEFFRSGGVSAPVPQQLTLTLRLGL